MKPTLILVMCTTLAAPVGAREEDPTTTCIELHEASSRYDPLRAKLPASTRFVTATQMTDPLKPNQAERQALAALIEEFQRCVNSGSSFRSERFPREAILLFNDLARDVTLLTVDLYDRKLTFGQYNRRIYELNKQSLASMSNVRGAILTRLAAESERRSVAAASERRLQEQRLIEANDSDRKLERTLEIAKENVRIAEQSEVQERAALHSRRTQQESARSISELREFMLLREHMLGSQLFGWFPPPPIAPITTRTPEPRVPTQTNCIRVSTGFSCINK
jgi:hypothetical protein